MKRPSRQPLSIAWLTILAIVVAPWSGLCAMPVAGAPTPASGAGCHGGHSQGAACCCDEPCGGTDGSHAPDAPAECPRLESSGDHYITSSRAGTMPETLPVSHWLLPPAAFVPETVRCAIDPQAPPPRSTACPEAQNSLLAQGCALNT